MQVVLSEVLTPMGDTVNFINHKPLDHVPRVQIIHARHQPRALDHLLRRQVNQLILASLDLLIIFAYPSLLLLRAPIGAQRTTRYA